VMKKWLAGLMVCMMLLNFPFAPAVLAEELARESKSAILMEISTGRILYDENSHEQLAPASMTKMMPMYLVLEAIADGRLDWDQELHVSEHAASLGGAQVYLEPGEVMTVRDLFKSVAIASANDSVTALGEAVSGSEAAFVELMNERAQDFGMENTVFKNPTGLTEDGHITTAYDMALLSIRLVSDFPEVLEYTSLYESYIREDSESPFWLVNTNKLVRFVDGVDGLKTGYTRDAGFCLSATAQRGGMRVVAVVMGAPRSDVRNREIAQLMEHAFANYELHPRLEMGEIVGTGYNVLAKGRQFNVVTTQNLGIVMKIAQELAPERYEVEILEDLTLPIMPGDTVGTLIYYYDDEIYSKVPLTVDEPVEKNSFTGLFTHVLGSLLFGNR